MWTHQYIPNLILLLHFIFEILKLNQTSTNKQTERCPGFLKKYLNENG